MESTSLCFGSRMQVDQFITSSLHQFTGLRLCQATERIVIAMHTDYFVPESNFDFDTFRSGFAICFQEVIYRNLKPCLGRGMELKSFQVGDAVRSTFLARVIENPSRLVHPMIHGTRQSNLSSIFERGFLIPDDSNDVQRRNAWTFGKGVYFANINAPWLSLRFSSGSPCLVVCAVLQDDTVTAVRDSKVVSDVSFCVPLFIAKGIDLRFVSCEQCSDMLLSDDIVAMEVLHRGYIVAHDVRNLLHSKVPVCKLLDEGYTPETLMSGGYSHQAIYEQRFHLHFGLISFPALQKLLPDADCCSVWARMEPDDARH